MKASWFAGVAGGVASALFLIGAGPCGGGGAAPQGAAPVGAVPAYRIVAGDRVHIEMEGAALDPTEVPVPPDGRIAVPRIGVVACAGRTPAEVEADLARLAADAGFVGTIRPSVTVLAFAPRRVYLLQGVREPGAYDLAPGTDLRLTQVLSLAGGVAPEGDRTRIRILRPRPEGGLPAVLRFDLARILEAGKIENDVRILPGDTILLPDRRNPDGWVHVTGAVGRPGRYPFLQGEGLTVARLVAEAGGLSPSAQPSSVVVLRSEERGGEEAHPVDLTRAFRGDPAGDLPLEAGDLVLVPGSP